MEHPVFLISYFPYLSPPPSSQMIISNCFYGCFLILMETLSRSGDYKWKYSNSLSCELMKEQTDYESFARH